jgi:hypothetical protein
MSTDAAIEFDQLCQDYMNAVYQGVSGFISYQPGEKEAGQEKKIFLTYGEILYPSVNKIIDCMNIDENDVFYDLGSGIGKVTLQYFLKSPVKKAVGIEASETRHNTALEVYGIVRKEFPDLFAGGRELNSICGNFLMQDISDATIIYTCSTCFDEELLQSIGELADRCPNLKYLATNKKIPNKLPLTSVVDVDCTWDKTKWHIYGIVKEGMAFLPEEEPLLLDDTEEDKST